MAFSYIDQGPKGSGDTLTVPPYIKQSHISVQVDGLVVSPMYWEWSGPSVLTCLVGFPTGSNTRVLRVTSINENEAVLVGAASFDFEAVNTNDTQLLYRQQEQADGEADRQAAIDQLTAGFDDLEEAIEEAEADANRAEQAAAIATGLVNAQMVFDTKAIAAAASIPSVINAVTLSGGTTVGDGLGGLYIDTNNGSADTFLSSGPDARTWYRAKDVSVEDRVTSFATWSSSRLQTLKDRLRRECHVLDFVGPHDSNASTSELRAWLSQAQTGGVAAVLGGDGSAGQYDFITEGELEITKPGQVVRFEQTGGFAYGESDPRQNWHRGTRLKAAGTLFASSGERVRTRRLFRGSAGDPQDAGLSCVLNVQAEGVQLHDPCIWLNCDYSNASPSNLGDDCDIGIFVGCRVAVQIHRPIIVGYFRKASIYIDVSGASNLPRHLSLAGSPYDDGSVRNGADGWHIEKPYLIGGRVGLAVLGARPKVGQTGYSDPYYDQQLGTTVTDGRGSFGASDGLVLGGWIHSAEHHSDRRLANPTPSAGTLNTTSLHAEPDTMPAAVYIDGLAGNASSNLWGMRFVGTRIATFEAFRLRTRKASRVSLIGCHIEGRNTGGRMNTSGTIIDTNDYTLHTYGDQAGETISDRMIVLGTPRQNKSDGAGTHFYGPSFTYLTDSGRFQPGAYMIQEQAGVEMDMRAASYRFRNVGASTLATIDSTGQADFAGGEASPTKLAAANIANIAHAINTTGKFENKRVWDTTNNRELRASGSSAGSAWHVVGGGATVTPA